MSEFRPEKSENPPERTVLLMSAVCEASDLMRLLAEPCLPGDSVKAAINRAAKRASRFLLKPMSFGRAEDIWRKEARAIRSEEMDALRRASKREQETRDEALALEARLARIEAALVAIDPDFHRDAIDALRRAARPLGQSPHQVTL